MNHPWLLAALLVLSLAALGSLIRAVLRTLRAARICDVPLLQRQQIDFPDAGRVVLCMEGPRFTPRFRKLTYELLLPGNAPLAGKPILYRTVTSGCAKARVTLRNYDLPQAGRYLLDIHGLEPQDVGAPAHSIVFMRPHTAQSSLLVVGIVMASMIAIASLVFFLLSVIPTAAAIDPGRAAGYVQMNGERVELHQAFAHLHPNREGRLPFTPELRIVVADREIPQDSLAGTEALPVLQLARDGKVRGLLIRLDPDDPKTVLVTPLAPRPHAGGESLATLRYTVTPVVTHLQLTPQRVGGDITCVGDRELQCQVHFSAPVFNE